MDDAAAGERQDALVEMSFYVPKEAEGFAGEGEDTSVKARPPRAQQALGSRRLGFKCRIRAGGDELLRAQGGRGLCGRGRGHQHQGAPCMPGRRFTVWRLGFSSRVGAQGDLCQVCKISNLVKACPCACPLLWAHLL